MTKKAKPGAKSEDKGNTADHNKEKKPKPLLTISPLLILSLPALSSHPNLPHQLILTTIQPSHHQPSHHHHHHHHHHHPLLSATCPRSYAPSAMPRYQKRKVVEDEHKGVARKHLPSLVVLSESIRATSTRLPSRSQRQFINYAIDIDIVSNDVDGSLR